MRPLRYSLNVTLDGCCDHRVMIPDEDMHRHATENLAPADALLLGRVTYEMMEEVWRPPWPAGAWPDWMESFARTIISIPARHQQAPAFSGQAAGTNGANAHPRNSLARGRPQVLGCCALR